MSGLISKGKEKFHQGKDKLEEKFGNDVSIVGARIKQFDASDKVFEIWGSASNIVSKVGTAVGSETTENIGIVMQLVGKLIKNTTFSPQSSDSVFKFRRPPIYKMIYAVQNEQDMLAVPGVEPINMKRSEFLDAKHIRLVLFVCHKTSDVISDIHY
jgi:hypothetical protein